MNRVSQYILPVKMLVQQFMLPSFSKNVSSGVLENTHAACIDAAFHMTSGLLCVFVIKSSWL